MKHKGQKQDVSILQEEKRVDKREADKAADSRAAEMEWNPYTFRTTPVYSEDDDIHKQFDAEIPEFFEDRLDVGQLERFLDHYDSCKDCQDELSIQYLIHEGLAKLETGEAFNLEKDLTRFVDGERTRLVRRERWGHLTALYEVLTLLAFAAAVVVYLMFYVL